ncbi:hypothetical protein K491DRAFT_721333 [Lophiostoma macrostomum CBS 122681]|uniref:Lytic polysaccharide monooxygenase n=1 Tax=Lophiostoma macrostomum CBS 122681 TaxID=1314788 RepID=A0A6A6SS39_9PLEO|nr:hypothetical protein K491DRAFT_721333 [Lophiostoma macrostomum CBS 122681]
MSAAAWLLRPKALLAPWCLVLVLLVAILADASSNFHHPPPGTQSFAFPQPIIQPTASSTISPGATFTVTWNASTHFSNITLELWDNTTIGYSRLFSPTLSSCYRWNPPYCGNIAVNVANTGSYDWVIPTPSTDDWPSKQSVFRIKMYVIDYWKPDVGNLAPVLSFSDWFAFSGNGKAAAQDEGGASAKESTSETKNETRSADKAARSAHSKRLLWKR